MKQSFYHLFPAMLVAVLLFACQRESKPISETTNDYTDVAEQVPATENIPVTEEQTTPTTTATIAEHSTTAQQSVANTTVATNKNIATAPPSSKTLAAATLPTAKTKTLVKPTTATPPTATDAKSTTKNDVAMETTKETEPIYKGSSKTTGGAAMSFDETSYEFGTVVVGTKIEHNFSFKNNGTAPLIIDDAKSTCGCTIPDIPLEPILPGQSNVIHVMFDTKGKVGEQNKVVTILTNAGTKQISLKGTVLTENMMKKEKEGENKN